MRSVHKYNQRDQSENYDRLCNRKTKERERKNYVFNMLIKASKGQKVWQKLPIFWVLVSSNFILFLAFQIELLNWSASLFLSHIIVHYLLTSNYTQFVSSIWKLISLLFCVWPFTLSVRSSFFGLFFGQVNLHHLAMSNVLSLTGVGDCPIYTVHISCFTTKKRVAS